MFFFKWDGVSILTLAQGDCGGSCGWLSIGWKTLAHTPTCTSPCYKTTRNFLLLNRYRLKLSPLVKQSKIFLKYVIALKCSPLHLFSRVRFKLLYIRLGTMRHLDFRIVENKQMNNREPSLLQPKDRDVSKASDGVRPKIRPVFHRRLRAAELGDECPAEEVSWRKGQATS